MAEKCADAAIGSNIENISSFFGLDLNFKMLKPLDEVLRCRICDDYFNNCMMTKCSHNYCSVCIRRYMMYKAQCPTCFKDAAEPELRNNRLIDEIIRIYKKISENVDNDVLASETQTETPKYDSSVNTPIKKELKTETNRKEKTKDAKEISSDEVSCPVCYKLVPESIINIHLDSCLKMKEKESVQERKSLPKLVYHLLSDKDIRKKLKEHGLNSSGNRQAIIRRHKNYIILFNANCDSLNPKPASDLVKELELQELEEHLNSLPREIRVNKKSDISDIEKEHESYVKKHQSQFNNLINDVQQRHIERISVKQEIQKDDSNSSGTSQNVTDNSTEVVDKASIKLTNDSTPDETQNIQLQESLISESDSGGETTIPSEKSKGELCSIECIKKEPISPTKLLEESFFSKSLEKIHQPFENDSPPEKEKITNLNLLRKRKKGKVSLENQYSPKKK